MAAVSSCCTLSSSSRAFISASRFLRRAACSPPYPGQEPGFYNTISRKKKRLYKSYELHINSDATFQGAASHAAPRDVRGLCTRHPAAPLMLNKSPVPCLRIPGLRQPLRAAGRENRLLCGFWSRKVQKCEYFVETGRTITWASMVKINTPT